MSRMIVVSIDDNAKAKKFLASLQEHKVVAYQNEDGTFSRAPVLFAYLTDERGGILPPTREEEL